MANFPAGAYTIPAASQSGVSTGSNTATQFKNLVAAWPTGAFTLANFYLRITSGAAAGTFIPIVSNTATVITIASWPGATPSADNYEIIWYIQNGDHITGNITQGSNIWMEVADNANIYIDGNYYINVPSSTTGFKITATKTPSTYCWWQANNRTVQGKFSFWQTGPIYISDATPTGTISFKYQKITETALEPLYLANSTAVGSAVDIGPVWVENCAGLLRHSGNITQDFNIPAMFVRYSNFATNLTIGTSTYTHRLNSNVWAQDCGCTYFIGATAVNTNMVWKGLVAVNSWGGLYSSGASTKYWYKSDFYIDITGFGAPSAGAGYLAYNVGAAGNAHAEYIRRNTTLTPQYIYGNTNAGAATCASQFNDCATLSISSLKAISQLNVGSWSALTSDNDYISGCTLASKSNIDTVTGATTSTASPVQWANLTSNRTNAKSVRNKPLTVDNVVVGTPGGDSCTITFDCANGTVSGNGNTTVTSDSASGQAVLNVGSSTGFIADDTVEIGYGTARAETGIIASVGAGTITLTTNLVNTHTAAQGDAVTQVLRHIGLPFMRYGTASGSYTMSTQLPDKVDWGLYYTGWLSTFNGQTFTFKQTGHSVTLAGLAPSTTYYATPYVMTPLGEVCAGSEQSFTTALSTAYSDPGIANVNTGTSYLYANSTMNGTLTLPAASTVETGTVYGVGGTGSTGTYTGANRWSDPGSNNVRLGISYQANSLTNNQTGLVTVPTAANVQVGVTFDTSLSITGTYDGSNRWSDPGVSVVLLGVTYQANSLTPNRTGTFAAPTAATIAAAVWDELKSAHTTPGTFGVNLDAKVSDTNTTSHFDTIIGTPVATVSGDIAAVKSVVDTIDSNVDVAVSSRVATTHFDTIIGTPVLSVSLDIAGVNTNVLALPSNSSIANAVLDAPINSHLIAGSVAKTIKDTKTAALAGL